MELIENKPMNKVVNCIQSLATVIEKNQGELGVNLPRYEVQPFDWKAELSLWIENFEDDSSPPISPMDSSSTSSPRFSSSPANFSSSPSGANTIRRDSIAYSPETTRHNKSKETRDFVPEIHHEVTRERSKTLDLPPLQDPKHHQVQSIAVDTQDIQPPSKDVISLKDLLESEKEKSKQLQSQLELDKKRILLMQKKYGSTVPSDEEVQVFIELNMFLTIILLKGGS
jgi:hypothetical protein